MRTGLGASTRRSALVVAAGLAVVACGPGDRAADPTTPTAPTDTTVTPTDPPDATEPQGDVTPIRFPARSEPTTPSALAGGAVADFGTELFGVFEHGRENVVISPLSIAFALAMLEPGANDEALAQLDRLLRIDEPVEWHASMNTLEQDLESRVAELTEPASGPGTDPGEVEVAVANAAFVQPGYPFRPEYLDTIGTNYGAVVEELDFAADQAAAAARINEFIADATDDHITDLVPPGAIRPETVLALVNALLLRASWLSTFDAELTADADFTRLDGTTVTVPMMRGAGDHSGRGDGWVAARKALVGVMRLEVVLPDEGRFDDVVGRLDEVWDEVGSIDRPGGELGMPRFETRVDVPLTDALGAAGLTAPFEPGQLLGIAGDERLVLDQALHQTWLSVDEDGIEAAAATVLVAAATSAPVEAPIPVVLDRPFLFRIVDDVSDAVLFVGSIADPTT